MTINRTFYISKKSVAQAGDFIMSHGRDIEKMLYQFHFGSETAANVITTLESYCNEDGGVGRLELDFEYEGSTPINTAIFLSIIHDIKVQADFRAVGRALDYLKAHMNEDHSWYPITPAVNTEPRAIWWQWDETKMQGYSMNPTCEIIGYFYHFGGGDYRAFAKELLDVLYDELTIKPIKVLQMHDAINLMQLCRVLPDMVAERFIVCLKPHLLHMMIRDKAQWHDYIMSPLTVFKSPLDPLYYDFEKEVAQQLDYEVTTQSDNGTWKPNWHWWRYENEFKARENELISYVTLNKLIQFKNFGRITKMG